MLTTSVLALIISLVTVCLLVLGISYALLDQSPLELTHIAVVISGEDDVLTRMAVEYVSSMGSVSSVSSFSYCSESDAYTDLQNGSVQAILSFPEHFFEDVDRGLNPPATLIFTDHPDLPTRLFQGLVLSGVRMLQISESGVYAVLEAASLHPVKAEASSIGNIVAYRFAGLALNRSEVFDSRTLSAYGTISRASYYYQAFLLILLLICGVQLGFLYEDRSRAFEDRLSLFGIGSACRSFVRILCMSLFLWMISLIYLAIGALVSHFAPVALFDSPILLISLKLLPLSLFIACYYHVLFEVCGSGIFGAVPALCIALLQIICCGAIIPVIYLPHYAASAGAYLPAGQWLFYLHRIFGNLSSGSAQVSGPGSITGCYVYCLLLSTLFFLLGTLFHKQRTMRK